jgi:hypothetical protein
MCGIFALIGSDSEPNDAFKLGSKRGPEISVLEKINNLL